MMPNITAAAILFLAAMASAAQAAAYKAPRTPDGHPDLNGIWQALNSAHWDVEDHAAAPPPLAAFGAVGAVPQGLGVVEGGGIPYQPWAATKKKENYANRLTADPEGKCYLPGVPRATYMPQPFQIVQAAKSIMIAYQYATALRAIHLEATGPSPAPSGIRGSAGHWEGVTMLADVTCS